MILFCRCLFDVAGKDYGRDIRVTMGKPFSGQDLVNYDVKMIPMIIIAFFRRFTQAPLR